MANRQRIDQALLILEVELRAFVEAKLRQQYREDWEERAKRSLNDSRAQARGPVHLDVTALIRITLDRQHRGLYESVSPKDRTYLQEIRDIRNGHAHTETFDDSETDRALDTITRFLRVLRSPSADQVSAMRKESVIAEPTLPTPAATATLQTTASPEMLERGVRLFRYLAERASKGNAVGIGYGDFLAFVHDRATFLELMGRKYLPSDSGTAMALAWAITDANGGRIPLSAGGRTIEAGMDTFIWASSTPYDRTDRAWQNPKYTLPYSKVEWRAIFPDGNRRLIKQAELDRLR